MSWLHSPRCSLKCLESPSGFGANGDFTKLTTMENGLASRDLVLSFFSDVSLEGH